MANITRRSPPPVRRRLACSPVRARRWLSMAWQTCVVAVAAASVAGCVGMPSNGPVGAISVSPQGTTAGGAVIQPFPSGPKPGESPSSIVQGFLAASANYSANGAIAREYLTESAARTWNPPWAVTVFQTFGPPQTPPPGPRVRQTKVTASGQVQSTFNGSGQFVFAGQGSRAGTYSFNVTKVGGQWRISNPPNHRLLTGLQFSEFYRPQDLYFLNQPVSAGQPLVPDSVFVPVGTPTTDLLNNLVNALLPDSTGDPQSSLLKTAAETFPSGTTLESVAMAGTTAVVNLGGLQHANNTYLEEVSAQLVWTLASPRTGPPAAIQSVELERNGHPWTPPGIICGVKQIRSQVQNQAAYSCYNPYPSSPGSFSFTGRGQVWARCGSEASAQRGLIGPVVSLFRATSGAASAPPACGSGTDVPTGSAASPGLVPSKVGTPTLSALSPDGQYAAAYSPAAKALYTWQPSRGVKSATDVPEVTSGVTALSWDRSDDLWFTQNGEVFMIPGNRLKTQAPTQVPGLAGVTDLSVAPDGVRLAYIVGDGANSAVDLTAIIRSPPSTGQIGSSSEPPLVSRFVVHLGPDLREPQDLTWYDADDLIVLANNDGLTLAEVPVDGQESDGPVPAPPGAVSITADSAMNALVAGRSDGRLLVSTGLEGPWQVLSVPGQNPAYPAGITPQNP